jgi:hypothetical protein
VGSKEVRDERYSGGRGRDQDRRRGGLPGGEIFREVRYPTQAVPPNRLVELIARSITEAKDGFEVGGMCVAAPGLILAAENRVVFASNLHEIENIRLDEELGRRTGLGVTQRNFTGDGAEHESRAPSPISRERFDLTPLG